MVFKKRINVIEYITKPLIMKLKMIKKNQRSKEIEYTKAYI